MVLWAFLASSGGWGAEGERREVDFRTKRIIDKSSRGLTVCGISASIALSAFFQFCVTVSSEK